jgi:DNA polymerase elongation subunit (family B)
MAERDPGNEPATNERIPYVAVEIDEHAIKSKKKSQGKEDRILQGDKIEHPDYIEKSKLKVDYKFYLTNQIMNPTVQFLDIVMDNSSRMFDEAIKNEVYSKIGMKQNNLSNYFKTKKVVYEDVNVYSEGKDDNAANDSESDKSFKICDD